MQWRHKRLGEYLQETCGIGGYQIYRALKEQAELTEKGQYRPCGQVLVDLGFASEGQIDEALELQMQDLIRYHHYRALGPPSASTKDKAPQEGGAIFLQ